MTSKKYSLSDFMSNREVFLLMIGALPQTPQGALPLDPGRDAAPAPRKPLKRLERNFCVVDGEGEW